MTDAAVVLSLRYVPINTEKDAMQTKRKPDKQTRVEIHTTQYADCTS